ncbi:unnamed protein product [Paramecium octaurelia]|uniref:Uncharacterized protein n=1 Tax=Paramecium octaurelia TaxID=43137 RepID=A0A8S1WRA6_PAROT|nr:unnamed protein product [Paramecium octaurelia]
MNICLLSLSTQFKDFIYLINKILKNHDGITSVSQRLYKPPPIKSDYQKKQLKRPSNVFHTQSHPPKQQLQQQILPPEQILNSIVTIASDELDPQIQQHEDPHFAFQQIPQTFLQTMSYNLKEQGLINKLKNTLKDQISYLQESLDFYNNINQKYEIIQTSRANLEANDKTQRLKAWSYYKANQQMKLINEKIDLFSIPIGFKIQHEKIYNTTKEQMKTIIHKHIQQLKISQDALNSYKFENFFDNQNVERIFNFLIAFQEAYEKCENTKSLLIIENSLCDALHTLRIQSQTLFDQIKAKYEDWYNKFQEKDGQYQMFLKMLQIRIHHMPFYYLTQTPIYESKHHQDVLKYMDEMLFIQQSLSQYQDQIPFIFKFLKLRNKQLKTLEIIINYVNSDYPYNKSLIIDVFYLKEVKLLDQDLTTFDYLLYLSTSIKELQDTLIQKSRFVSSITLQILDLSKLNTEEKIIEVKEIKKVQKKEPKQNLLDKQKQYLKNISQKNKTEEQFIQSRLNKDDEKLKIEKENKIERLKAKLLRQTIAQKQEEKNYEFLLKKYRYQENQSNLIIQKEEKKRRNFDILGQMLYLILDARLKLYKTQQKETYDQIINFYGQHMYQKGIPKKFKLSTIQQLYESIYELSKDFRDHFNQYFLDKQVKNYLNIVQQQKNQQVNEQSQLFQEAKQVDFINFSLTISLKLLNIIYHHKSCYSIQRFIDFDILQLPDLDFYSLKHYLQWIQKNAENTFDYLQKNSDGLLRFEWIPFLNGQVKCSEKQQEKLFELIKKINHCYILEFEVIRYIVNSLTRELFHENTFKFDLRQLTKDYIVQSTKQQLQDKMKYFPKLNQELLIQLEPFLLYLEQKVLCNLEAYYIISIIQKETVQNLELEQIIQNNEYFRDSNDVWKFKYQGMRYILEKNEFKNNNLSEMINEQMRRNSSMKSKGSNQGQFGKSSLQDKYLELIQLNNLKNERIQVKKPLSIILEVDYKEDQKFLVRLVNESNQRVSLEIKEEVVSDVVELICENVKDKGKGKWVMKINNEKINFSQIDIWSYGIPKWFNLIINGQKRDIRMDQNILQLERYLMLRYNSESEKELFNIYQYK